MAALTMTAFNAIELQTNEEFQHLNNAPIVEAVIGISARATAAWEEKRVRSAIEPELTGYVFLDSQSEFQQHINLASKPGEPPTTAMTEVSWTKIRFKSSDGAQIATFGRDGFSFSRLKPYGNWDALHSEAMRLWSIFLRVARPGPINRIGLRYINQIPLDNDSQLPKYLEHIPSAPNHISLQFASFFHHDVFEVPGHPYGINVIKTKQPPAKLPAGFAVILDIDVFTRPQTVLDHDRISHYLLEMKWLKNKAFFGSITKAARELFA